MIDAALYESVLQVMEGLVPEYDRWRLIRERSGSFLTGIAPSNVYRCKRRRIHDRGQQGFAVEAAGRGDGAARAGRRSALCHPSGARENQIELDALINDWTRTLTIDEVDALMIAHSIPAGKVYRAPEMLADPHFAAREAIIEVETERFGKLKMQNAFPKLSATPLAFTAPAPSVVGQHNAEVYGELLGLGEAELAELAKAGAI